MDIAALFRVLLERKWILIFIPLLAAVVTFFVMSSMPKEYKSKSQISTGFTINNDIAQLDGSYNAREADIKFGNLMETMKSPILIGMLSYRMMLHDLTADYPFKRIEDEKLNTLRSSPNNYVGNLTKQQLSELLESKLDSITLLTSYKENEKEAIQLLRFYGYDYDAILRNLQVKRANYSDYINIEFTSANPELSAFATNAIVEELIRYNNNMSSSRLDRSLEYYTRLVQQKREELDEKSDALKTFKASNQVVNFNAENEANVSQIAGLEVKRQEEERNVYRLRLAIDNVTRRLNEAGGEQSGGVSNNAQLIQVREQINNLNRQYRETNNPSLQLKIDSLRALQIELAGASTAFSQDGQRLTRNDLLEEREQLRIELAVADRSLGSIQSTLALLKGNTTGLASKEATIAGLQREVDMAAQEYLEAQEKYNIARNTSQGSINTISQVLFGQPAVKPESSKIWIFTALGWALSFSLCLVSIILLEFVDVSIKTVPQLEKLSGIPVLGAINHIDSKKVDLGEVFSNDRNLENVPEIELYRRLIRKIRYEIEAKKSKIILVTSTKQAEGKSFLILSLAYSLSLIQKKVLIIDTNFKNNSLTRMLIAKPRFDKLLETSNYRHAAKLLVSPEGDQFEEPSSSKDDVKDKYKQTIISPTFLENIDIIGSKGGDESPAEILSGRNFKEVLSELADDYDYIFLEGASLNDYSDSKELVEFSDLVLPVFSAQSVLKQMDKESIAYLKRLDGKLIGSVLNKVEAQDLNL